MSEEHVRALRKTADRSRGRLAGYERRGGEAKGPAAHRRDGLERTARHAAARLAAVEARLRRGPEETS